MNNIVIIGGGPGGYVAAIRAAQLGATVTLVEKNKIGGTCLNVGCIPTKALLHAAELKEKVREAANYGVNFGEAEFSWDKVMAQKDEIVFGLVNGIKGLLRANKIKIVSGTASFVSAGTLKVVAEDGSESLLNAEKIIIASGSVPSVPPITGIDGSSYCIDSTGALSLRALPASMVIIGGGVIGIEFATAFSALGTKVTIVEALPRILPTMDGELTGMLHKMLERAKINIMTGAKVLSVMDKENQAEVTAEVNGTVQVLQAEKVLVAVGRRTATEELNLEAVGIGNDRGRIYVNDRMETNVPGVYAIGDCLGKVMLAHTASAQGEVAAENAMGGSTVFNGLTAASCVYCSPEFAGIGLTQEQADVSGIDYIVGKFPLTANGKAIIENGGKGVVKLIFDKKDKKLIGAHILGSRATDLISECGLALEMGATLSDLTDTIHAHPTISEAVKEAALAAEKRAIHNVN